MHEILVRQSRDFAIDQFPLDVIAHASHLPGINSRERAGRCPFDEKPPRLLAQTMVSRAHSPFGPHAPETKMTGAGVRRTFAAGAGLVSGAILVGAEIR